MQISDDLVGYMLATSILELILVLLFYKTKRTHDNYMRLADEECKEFMQLKAEGRENEFKGYSKPSFLKGTTGTPHPIYMFAASVLIWYIAYPLSVEFRYCVSILGDVIRTIQSFIGG